MKLLLAFACAAVLVAVLAPSVTSAEEHGKPHPHIVLRRSSPPKNGAWHQREGSPTSRRTIKDSIGQEIHHTVDSHHGIVTSGYLAKGEAARQDSPHRSGQPSSAAGPASTSQKSSKPKKGKGH